MKEETGKTVGVAFDRAAIIEDIKHTIDAEALNREQLAAVDRAIAASIAANNKAGEGEDQDNVIVTVSDLALEYTPTTTESFATESEDTYLYTPYTLNDSRCVMLTYTKDKSDKNFVLNYNLCDVEVRYTNDSAFTVTTFTENGQKMTENYEANEVALITISSYDFVRIDVKGGN